MSGSRDAAALGTEKVDAITNEHVQGLKLRLSHRAPKTVNNVLTVLDTMLKVAVECRHECWHERDR